MQPCAPAVKPPGVPRAPTTPGSTSAARAPDEATTVPTALRSPQQATPARPADADRAGVPSQWQADPFRVISSGAGLGPPGVVALNPKYTVCPGWIRRLVVVFVTVTVAPSWVAVADHASRTRWPPRNANRVVHPSITVVPVLVSVIWTVKPPLPCHGP